jgi:uncharacterized protein with von Willebrand factor type A (vWA) domain
VAAEGYDAVATVVGLARTLRAAGVDATPERVARMVSALAELDPLRRADVYWAGRLTLCASPDDLARYDRAFDAYFDRDGATRLPMPLLARPRLRLLAIPATGEDAAGEPDGDAPVATAAASLTEVLRQRDIAGLTERERVELRRLLAAFRAQSVRRRTRRLVRHRRGGVDRHRTVRAVIRHGGEPAVLLRRRRGHRPRRVVLLLDVSGSMSAYADALLRFSHAARHRSQVPTEIFTIGTRLTRVSRELASRDPELAMRAVAGAVPDWGGGTRLGQLLKKFLDEWGQRGMARGAVVVVLSDGWERGAPDQLGEQMARLHRLAYRVIWANPRRARPGFAPLAAGMAAALPHVDHFVDGHSLQALESLARVVAGAVSTDA